MKLPIRPHTVADLIRALKEAPDNYTVLICNDGPTTGSTWTDALSVDIDHTHKVVRVWCVCT